MARHDIIQDLALPNAVAKTTPVDADNLLLFDSAASNIGKTLSWANVKAGILVYFNTTNKTVPIDADRIWLGDSTSSNTPKYSTWTQVKAFLKTYFDTLYLTAAAIGVTVQGFDATTLKSAAIGVTVQAFDAQLSSLVRVNSQSAAYTLVLTDGGKCIYHPPADTTARVWTMPSNAAVPYPIGTVIQFDNDFGAGAITIAITADDLVLVGAAGSTGSRTLATGGRAVAEKMTATRWRISGQELT